MWAASSGTHHSDTRPSAPARHPPVLAYALAMVSPIEANFADFILSMGTAGGGRRRDGRATWIVGGSPISYHNALIDCAATSLREAAEVVAGFLAELQAADIPGTWHLSSSMTPSGLEGLLVDAGFRFVSTEPMMRLDLSTWSGDAATALSIEVVSDVDGLDRYRTVLADGFGEGPPEAEWVADVFGVIGFDGNWHHLVGSDDGAPVATASVLLTGATAGLYFVATRPAWRRRGHGAAMTSAALDLARTAGADLAVLGSSAVGHSLYRSLGFTDAGEHRIYEWQRPES